MIKENTNKEIKLVKLRKNNKDESYTAKTDEHFQLFLLFQYIIHWLLNVKRMNIFAIKVRVIDIYL